MDIIISIPILTYNHEPYIAEALDGILSQKTSYNYEIIIGEDCSTDNTMSIIKSYAQKYPEKIKIISSETNVGAIENAKRIVNACKGKYLALCEGDDFWTDPNKLQKQIDFLEANSDYGLVHTDVNHFLEKEKVLLKNINKNKKINFPSGNIFSVYLSSELFIKTATVVVIRELFIKASDYNLFAQKKWMLQDLPTWLEITHKTKVKYLPISTATYRIGDESASRTSNHQKAHKFHLDVFDIRYFFWRKYSNNKIIKKILDKKYAKMLIGDAYKMKDRSLAKKALKNFSVLKLRLDWKELGKLILIYITTIGKKSNK